MQAIFDVASENPALVEELKSEFTHERFAALIAGWWELQARQTLRRALAAAALEQYEDAAGWASTSACRV